MGPTPELRIFEALPAASPALVCGFTVLPVLVAGAVALGIRHTSGAPAGRRALVAMALWMGLNATWGLTGVLDHWWPPRIGLVFVPVLVGLAWAARQPWTAGLATLPLGVLVGFQAFRIPVELLLHEAVLQRVANPNMTWTGTNLDIVAGVSALLLAPVAARLPRAVVQAWNLAMAGILVVTVVTAVLASPVPFRLLTQEPPNVFITGFPYVWLPAVLVSSAWLGHIVLFRRLRREARAPAAGPHLGRRS